MSPRQQLKRTIFQKRQHLKGENELWPKELVELPPHLWPFRDRPFPPTKVFRSRTHLVQMFEEKDGIVRLSINRAWIADDGNWAEEIEWETLMRLKREAGYGDRDAVEVYPADEDAVNVAAMRHLWVLPGFLAFAWRRKQKA